MPRTLVIGDIHGAYKALTQVLERANINKEDTLIFLGDYVDGWSQSPQVIDYLIQLNATHNCIFLRGNHDELCYNWFTTQKNNELWLYHGGKATVDAYNKTSDSIIKIHLHFIESLQNYYIDSKNRLFIHAGFTNQHGVEKEYYQKTFYWDRSLWEMMLALNTDLKKESKKYPKRLLLYNEIYIGHTSTTLIGLDTPFQIANVINVDTGAAFKGKISIMDVDTKEYWQSDEVYTLYPDENGRN